MPTYNKSRSSFTMRNAMKFEKIFDLAVKHRQDILIPTKGSPSAFHIKCSDALKWLVTYKDDKNHLNTLGEEHIPGSFAKLRGEIRFKSIVDTRDGKTKIRLSFGCNNMPRYEGEVELLDKEEAKDVESAEVEKVTHTTKNQFWRGQLIKEFIESEEYRKTGKIFHMRNLNLSDEDINWVSQLLGGLENCHFEVEETFIVAVVKTQVVKSEETK